VASATAFALLQQTTPNLQIFERKILCLGDDWGRHPGFSQVHPPAYPMLLRPFIEQQPEQIRAVPGMMTPACIIGPAKRLVGYLEGLQGQIERPQALLYTRSSSTSPVQALRERAGTGARLCEWIVRPEGPIALEDPRTGGFRLLSDHGVFFEFISPKTAKSPRLSLEEITLHTEYEVLMSSPAGVWATRSGVLVRFESVDPPVFRLLGFTNDVPEPSLPSVSHQPRLDIPATLPEIVSHSLWSARADQG
jgi:hypothetical protein